jgi:hypothetical protein
VPDEEKPQTYGSSGMPKRKAKNIPPEVAARRIANLKAARPDRRKMELDRVAAILHSPMDNLQKFKRLEWEIIGLHLSDTRLDNLALSKILGYRHEAIQRVLRRPHVQKFIAAVRAEQVAAMIRGDFGAQATLKAAQGKAAKKVVETIEAVDPKLGFTAAESVLDRTGLGKSSAVQHQHVHTILQSWTPEELERYGKGGPPPERYKELFDSLTPIDVTPDSSTPG